MIYEAATLVLSSSDKESGLAWKKKIKYYLMYYILYFIENMSPSKNKQRQCN